MHRFSSRVGCSLLFVVVAATAACGDVILGSHSSNPSLDGGAAAGNEAGAPVGAAPCPGGDSAEVLLASEPGSIDGLAIDGTDIYYAVSPVGTHESVIKRIPLSGGVAVELGRPAKPMGFVVSGEYIYVTPAGNGNYELLRLKKAGGPIETMPVGPDDSPVYVFSDGVGGVIYTGLTPSTATAPLVVRVASDGTRTALATSAPSVFVEHLIATPDSIFWSPGITTGDGSVYASPLAGGPSTTLYGPDTVRPVSGLAADTANVYFSHTGAIARVPKTGGPSTVFAAVDAAELVSDGLSIWYLGAGSFDGPTQTVRHIDVGRVAIAGGSPEIVRTELTFPARLSLGQCDVVYSTWHDDQSSTIHRRAK